MTISQAVMDVLDERLRQDKKWGEQNHAMEWWLAILTEEVGEFATEILIDHFDGRPVNTDTRKEAVQIAAVALAIVECFDRGKFPK